MSNPVILTVKFIYFLFHFCAVSKKLVYKNKPISEIYKRRMIKVERLKIIVYTVIASIFITGCEQEAAQEAPMQMPFKENTWVRKEAVTKSKVFSDKQIEALSVDDSLVKQLKNISTSISVNNEKECLAQVGKLDQRRTEVQKRGGLWHSFEKFVEAKRYSDYGMQLDSQLNRMIFSLKYICRATKGMPLDGWARTIVSQLEKDGKEKTYEYYIQLGRDSGDVEKWISFGEMAIESKKRNIPYKSISESISRSANMVGLYEKLSLQRLYKESLKSFLTKASTLLSVIKDSFISDSNIELSIKEENFLSIHDLEADSA